jgi:hypothetical protein
MRLSAFLGIASQVAVAKKEAEKLRLADTIKAMSDKGASWVILKAGEAAGQKGVLRSWASTDGTVSVLLEDGHTIQAAVTDIEKVPTKVSMAFDALDAEHKQVALENGFQPNVYTPANQEELKAAIDFYVRSSDKGMQLLGQQMVTNFEAMKAAQAKDADFSHLAVFASVRLKTLGPNQNEVTVGDKTIFFSYNTPVAAKVGGNVFVTDDKLSVTAQRHIKNWLMGREAKKISQSQLESLASEVQASAKKAGYEQSWSSKILQKLRAKRNSLKAEYEYEDEEDEGNVVDVEVMDIGIVEDYYQYDYPESTLVSQYDDVLIGKGYTYKEAAEDAIKEGEKAGWEFTEDQIDEIVYGSHRAEDDVWEFRKKFYRKYVLDNDEDIIDARAKKIAERDNVDFETAREKVISERVAEKMDFDDDFIYIIYLLVNKKHYIESNHCKLLKHRIIGRRHPFIARRRNGRVLTANGKTESSKGNVVDFEVEDIGVEHVQYFQGRGVSGSKWDDVFIGVGSSYNEAAGDALDMAAMSGYNFTPEQEKEIIWDDPKGDYNLVDKVRREALHESEIKELADKIAKEDGISVEEAREQAIEQLLDENVSNQLFYYVALYVKGTPDIEGSKCILARKRTVVARPRERKVLKEAGQQALPGLEGRKKCILGRRIHSQESLRELGVEAALKVRSDERASYPEFKPYMVYRISPIADDERIAGKRVVFIKMLPHGAVAGDIRRAVVRELMPDGSSGKEWLVAPSILINACGNSQVKAASSRLKVWADDEWSIKGLEEYMVEEFGDAMRGLSSEMNSKHPFKYWPTEVLKSLNTEAASLLSLPLWEKFTIPPHLKELYHLTSRELSRRVEANPKLLSSREGRSDYWGIDTILHYHRDKAEAQGERDSNEGQRNKKKANITRVSALTNGAIARRLTANGQTEASKGNVVDFEVEDIGVEHVQYFQGRGVSGSKWDDVFIGVGNSYNEAAGDALDMAAMSGYNFTPEQEKEIIWDDPKGDYDLVNEVLLESLDEDEIEELADEIAKEDGISVEEAREQAIEQLLDENASGELVYYVALYVKGTPDIEGSKRILVRHNGIRGRRNLLRAAPKPLSEKTQQILRRIMEQRRAEEENAAKSKTTTKLAPPPDLAQKAREAAKPTKPTVPPYPGIQKPEFRKMKTGEEAWRIKHEEPGKVKEADRPGKLKVSEDKPGEVDEKKLGKLQEAPQEVKDVVRSILKRQEFFEAVHKQLSEAAEAIKKAANYEEEVARDVEEHMVLDELLRNIEAEAATMDNAIIALIRGGLKPEYKLTEEDKRKLKELQDAQEKFLEEARARAEVIYTEERTPKLFSDPRKRKGEGATGLPGADTLQKANVRSSMLSAGVLDSLKKAWGKLKELGKDLLSKMKAANDVLRKMAANPTTAGRIDRNRIIAFLKAKRGRI